MKSLDLHGYTIEDAEVAIDQFLHEFSQSGARRAKIITGKGSGKIQSATIQYLKRAGYHWQHEKLSNGKLNTGVIILLGD
ncbi:MAG: Smr/MutS family protein [Bdellovibrionales bacterium]|nr:Smr/MutS family protein [Bdellovibrionales bacterium]